RLLIRPPQPNNNRNFQLQIPESVDDPLSNHVAASEPTKDVHEDDFHAGVRGEDLERCLDSLGGGFAACVEEVGAVAAVDCDGVYCVHRETGAVDCFWLVFKSLRTL